VVSRVSPGDAGVGATASRALGSRTRRNGDQRRERTATIREYAKELGLTFPLILDPSGKINSTYGVIGLLTTFLIARDGRAVALAIGRREWSEKRARALIQALLAEPTAGKATR